MAFDAFIKMDGIPGESLDDRHRGEIEVLSYSFGVSNSGTGSFGGGGGEGKATFQDFHFVSRLQKSSLPIFLACASGEHIKEAILTVRRTGGTKDDFYKVRLSDVLVTGYSPGGSGDGADSLPLEQTSLNFAKVRIDYSVQNPKGGLGEAISVEWDLSENREG